MGRACVTNERFVPATASSVQAPAVSKVSSSLQAASAALQAVGVKLLSDTDAAPGVAAALAASKALDVASWAVALEALTAVTLLRLTEGPAPAAAGEGGSEAAPAAAEADGDKKGKDKKKDRKGAQVTVGAAVLILWRM